MAASAHPDERHYPIQPLRWREDIGRGRLRLALAE